MPRRTAVKVHREAGRRGTLGSLLGVVVYSNDAGDAATGTPVAFERRAAGLGHRYEVVKDAIRDIFVKDPFISEAL